MVTEDRFLDCNTMRDDCKGTIMATMTVNGVVITFEPHEADSMIGAAMRLQEPKRTPPPTSTQAQSSPTASATTAPQTTMYVAPAAQSPRPRGRPRKLSMNPALENAVKALDLLLQRDTLTMEAVVMEFGLSSKMSIGGIATSVRASVTEAGFDAADAYRVVTTSKGKMWSRTARTEEVLQALKAKLSKLLRGH